MMSRQCSYRCFMTGVWLGFAPCIALAVPAATAAPTEHGRAANSAIVGQNAEPDARAELREPRTPLIGSVAYFPEKYGPEIVAVALDILHRRPVPPAVFVKHQLVTPDTVNHIYPNDQLMQISNATI